MPNNNTTWAADSFQPMAPMAIAKHAFFGERWNSGWFYFKYPAGHPLILIAAQAPYLAWLRATGQFHAPRSTYPYGFRHPERALTVLALLTRVVSVLMGVGIVALAYRIASMLFGWTAGTVAAVLTAGCYPIVFYAHTSNVDVPLLFWIALAVAATLTCAERDSRIAAAVAGIAVAMALLTKEQSLGALVMVPFAWLLYARSARSVEWNAAARHALAAGASCAAVTILLGNLWWNPMGYINRWRFLLGVLPAQVRDAYAPYQFQVQVPKGFSLGVEAARLLKIAGIVGQVLTLPVALLCVAGAVYGVWRRPRQTAVPLLLIAGYYVLSVRATALIQVRYTMPLLFFLLILGGALGGALIEASQRLRAAIARRLAAGLLAAALGCALLPGIEVVRLLVNDPRYAAEAWLRAHGAPRARVEIYEPLTYLPRFGADVQVAQVPVEERTIAQFQQRRPDFVVLSSGGHAGLTGRYVRDWQPGKPIIADVDAAKEFFVQLHGEQLGYRRVGHFESRPRWITPRINSLNPQITIFARDGVAQPVNG